MKSYICTSRKIKSDFQNLCIGMLHPKTVVLGLFFSAHTPWYIMNLPRASKSENKADYH